MPKEHRTQCDGICELIIRSDLGFDACLTRTESIVSDILKPPRDLR